MRAETVAEMQARIQDAERILREVRDAIARDGETDVQQLVIENGISYGVSFNDRAAYTFEHPLWGTMTAHAGPFSDARAIARKLRAWIDFNTCNWGC